MLSIRNRLRRFNATVDELTTRLFIYTPAAVGLAPSRTAPSYTDPSDTARFGILLSANTREHG